MILLEALASLLCFGLGNVTGFLRNIRLGELQQAQHIFGKTRTWDMDNLRAALVITLGDSHVVATLCFICFAAACFVLLMKWWSISQRDGNLDDSTIRLWSAYSVGIVLLLAARIPVRLRSAADRYDLAV